MNKYYTKIRHFEYNKEHLLQAIKNIESAKKEDITIFFDMDNTLFIFSTNSNDNLSLMLQEQVPHFFAKLPMMRYAKETIDALKAMGFKCKIISAAKPGQPRIDKIESIKINNLPFDEEDIIFVEHGKSKAGLLASMGYDISKCILVDDYYRNLFDWYAAGGLGIKKTFSGKKRIIPQVKELNELIDLVQKFVSNT